MQEPRRKRRSPPKARRARTAARSGDEACARDAEAFTEALVESGEAAGLDEKGRLPEGATHKLSRKKGGAVTVVRRRFSVA